MTPTRTWKCNACGATYADHQRDGSEYYHVCPPTTVQGVQPNPEMPGYTPPSVKARPDGRNENIRPNLRYVEGLPVLVRPDPADPARLISTKADSIIVAEGAGRTEVLVIADQGG
jgi:hypothetical protein